MANRIILSAVITLALTFTPSLAFSVPTKSIKKKTSIKAQGKTQTRVSKKSKTSKRSKYSRRRSRSASEDYVQSSMAPSYGARYTGASIPETPPLMKVTPQRDGGFLLEPMTPKKPKSPILRPSSKPTGQDKDLSAAPQEPKYNRFEPWNFSDLILAQAEYYKHTPYALGGSLATGNATDCSGFVQYIYHGFKINLPRSSAEQAQVGKVVTRQMDFSKLLPGDLLFFRRGGHSVGHAGIYLGDGKMIHASSYRTGVTITNLREGYYENTFVVAKRVFEVKYQN
jgi:cell wall-associated NlpC family hydrolase